MGRGEGREAGRSLAHPSTPRPLPLLLCLQLQEQLQRLLLVNAELRHKLAAVQTQLHAARDRERERELQSQGAVELTQDRTGGSGYEQRQEPERATADAGAPGNPEDPVSAHHRTHRSGTWWALGFSVLRSRSTRKAEGGTRVAGICSHAQLSSVAAPSPPSLGARHLLCDGGVEGSAGRGPH